MKHGSLVAPFLLIGIGILLLVYNLAPDIHLLELASTYWPYLLIVWGGLRLVELLAGAARGHALPHAGISGGEWALVVLICIVGAGTGAALDYWPKTKITRHGIEFFGESFDFPVTGQISTTESPRVVVENLQGNVRVVGADALEVKVDGRNTIRAFDDEDAREANASCPLEVLSQGDQIIVRTNHERTSGSWKVSSDLEIRVPKGASFRGQGRNGDFDIASIDGDVDIESDNAGVRLTQIGGNARVDVDDSDIIRIVGLAGRADIEGRGEDVELEEVQGQVTLKGSYSGELLMRKLAQPFQFESRRTGLQVERIPGQLRIALGDLTGRNLVGPIRLKTTNRDVHLADFTEELTVELKRGDVELYPGLAPLSRMSVEVEAGDVMLAIPESAKFGLVATARRGEAINEYGEPLSLKTTERGGVLRSPEDAQPAIQLNTNRGDIVVRKARSSPPPKVETQKSAQTEVVVETH